MAYAAMANSLAETTPEMKTILFSVMLYRFWWAKSTQYCRLASIYSGTASFFQREALSATPKPGMVTAPRLAEQWKEHEADVDAVGKAPLSGVRDGQSIYNECVLART